MAENLSILLEELTSLRQVFMDFFGEYGILGNLCLAVADIARQNNRLIEANYALRARISALELKLSNRDSRYEFVEQKVVLMRGLVMDLLDKIDELENNQK